MNWKHIFGAGAATGGLVATLTLILMIIELPSFGAFVATVLAIILISAFSVQKASQKVGCCEPSLKQLIPVAFLTFVIPVLGPALGAPDMDLKVVATLLIMGMVGGVFWSTPFALWSYFRGRSADSDSGAASISSGDAGENPPDTD